MDYPGFHGYRVRFTRQDDRGVASTKTKSFSDAVYGKRRAKTAAIEWREQYASTLADRRERAEPPGYWYVKKMRVSNNSQGVRHQYLAYVGFVRIENRRHLSTRWSIEKWGEQVAKLRCEVWVQKKLAELEARLRAADVTVESAVQRPNPLPAPLIKLTKQTCTCGGRIVQLTGPGRKLEYRPGIKGRIPSDFTTITCGTCGEHCLTADDYDALCNLMLDQELQASRKLGRKTKGAATRKAASRRSYHSVAS